MMVSAGIRPIDPWAQAALVEPVDTFPEGQLRVQHEGNRGASCGMP